MIESFKNLFEKTLVPPWYWYLFRHSIVVVVIAKLSTSTMSCVLWMQLLNFGLISYIYYFWQQYVIYVTTSHWGTKKNFSPSSLIVTTCICWNSYLRLSSKTDVMLQIISHLTHVIRLLVPPMAPQLCWSTTAKCHRPFFTRWVRLSVTIIVQVLLILHAWTMLIGCAVLIALTC